MARLCPTVLLAVLACLTLAAAQEQPKKEGAEPSPVDVRFADGSTVRMTLLQDSLDVETKYGKLTVPTRDIRRIDFAFRLSEETAKKIAAAVRDLGHDLHDRRETASKELADLGAMAVPSLQDATRSDDPEVARRAKSVLAQINEKTPLTTLRFPTADKVQTVEFTISGRIANAAIKARTGYFGDVQLKIADLHHMAWAGGGGEVVVTVDAAKYGSVPNQWMETDVTVIGQTGLLITASGQVDFQPQTPGQLVANPNGHSGLGAAPLANLAGFQQGAGARGKAKAGAPARNVAVMAGMLLGKIGENGDPFVIGMRYQGVPNEEGKLYLHIAPGPGNNTTGSYTVRVVQKP